MPIDPYAALNAMLRAEAARFSPPVRRAVERPAPQPAATAEPEAEGEGGPRREPADPAA